MTLHQKADDMFPVVGLGASAGGLQALRDFLEHTPDDCDMAFVIIVHLSPEHQSHLAELLQSHTNMPVSQVNEAMAIKRNHVYVIPPNRNLSSIDTHLRLSPLEDARSQRAPVDHFFRTLAHSHGDHAIGIVLTGGGSDGSVGLKDIKQAGGLILAQDPEEAAFDSMPRSAMATGLVDEVLPVGEMGPRLKAYVQHAPALKVPEEEDKLGQEERALLQRIFVQLRTVVGHDFSHYKRGTILRRIRRRMQLRGIITLEAYLERLRGDVDEVRALYKDLLIIVTNFFREPETYEALGEKVIPKLFEDRDGDDPIRVWVPGCATGEEAYSLAILLLEHADRVENPPPIQIFATDISEEALTVARNGLYSSAIETDVTPQRLTRFFRPEQDGYRVREEVRERLLFAQHSLLKDPPFSRLELISCRNVLIYMQRDLQSKIFELFHYALEPGGYLFIGTSEGVDDPRLFSPVSSKHSIFQRQEVATEPPYLPSFPFAARDVETTDVRPMHTREVRNYGALHQQLAERYAPPSVLLNEEHTILHVSENAGRYLRVPGGETTNNLLQLVRDEMRIELTTLLHRAFSKGRACRSNPIEVSFNGESGLVTLLVQPEGEEAAQRVAIVYFLESELREGAQTAEQQGAAQDGLVQELQEELTETKNQLRATIEEYEASKEEMKASNEELQSINEELRSMTEELETSKEELQSMNEELLTVNEENRHKVAELSELTADLQNLLAATDIATLFLDDQLRIQRFTPAASDLFNIRHTDRDRPLAHLTHKLVNYDGLMADADRVLREAVFLEREAQSEAGRHYLIRLLPYRTVRDEVDGVVVTLVDITTLRETEQALQASRERYRLLVEGTKEYAMLTMNEEGHIDTWNQGAQRILGYEEDEIIGRHGAVIFTPEDREAGAVEQELQRAREEGQAIDERWHLRKDGTRFWGSGVVTSLWEQGQLRGYAKVMRDNTARKQAEEALREREQQLSALTETLEERVQERTRQVRQLAGELVTSEQKVRHRISRILHDDLQQMLYALEMQLQFFRQDAQSDLVDANQSALEEMADVISDSIRLTRQLTVELSPPVLKGEGLPEALEWLTRHMREVYGLEVIVTTSGDPQTRDEEQRILLFQIVRELLFNVVKHAGVRQAHVDLQEEHEGITITVTDQGQGFDATKVMEHENGSFGLYHIRERMELFGGRADIHSQPEDGTRVTLYMPHDAPVDDRAER